MKGNQRAKGYEWNLKQLKKISKENHHGWKGGISNSPYCQVWQDQEYRSNILERDNYICQNPLCRQNCNHLSLHRHHINNDKLDCCPKNIITLCSGCNSRAKFNRQWWTNFYQNIMTEKHGYEYDN